MMTPFARHFAQPAWRAEDDKVTGWQGDKVTKEGVTLSPGHPVTLSSSTILLHAEQGFGDAMQFVRFAPLVKERFGTVLLESPPKLARLFKSCAGIDRVVIGGETLPAFDVHAPLMSLPGILGTTVATIPAKIPYLFADAGLVESWANELAKLDRRLGDQMTR